MRSFTAPTGRPLVDFVSDTRPRTTTLSRSLSLSLPRVYIQSRPFLPPLWRPPSPPPLAHSRYYESRQLDDSSLPQAQSEGYITLDVVVVVIAPLTSALKICDFRLGNDSITTVTVLALSCSMLAEFELTECRNRTEIIFFFFRANW